MLKGAEAFICIQPIAMITPCTNREKQLLSPFLNIVRTFRKLFCQQYDILLQIRTQEKNAGYRDGFAHTGWFFLLFRPENDQVVL